VETATGHANEAQHNYLRYWAGKISRDNKTRMKNELYQEENSRMQINSNISRQRENNIVEYLRHARAVEPWRPVGAAFTNNKESCLFSMPCRDASHSLLGSGAVNTSRQHLSNPLLGNASVNTLGLRNSRNVDHVTRVFRALFLGYISEAVTSF
jgi:hypothetical protein